MRMHGRLLPIIVLSACGGPPSPSSGDLPGAAIIGQIETGVVALTADVSMSVSPSRSNLAPDVTVNGTSHTVFVAPDHSFVIKELPTGTVDLDVLLGAAHGSTRIDDVIHGEVIRIVVREQVTGLGIEVMSRDRDRYDFSIPSNTPGGLQLTQTGDYFFEGGLLLGALLVEGQGIRVFGRNHDEPCTDRKRTIFTGDVSIRGDDAEIYDVGMRGRLIVTGMNVRVHDACDGVWSAAR
jgi:hypothetical protein